MTPPAVAVKRLNRLLKEERAVLLNAAHDRAAGMSEQLETALGVVEAGLTGATDPRLAADLRDARRLAAENAQLLQASLQGIRDAENLLSSAKGAGHSTYAADGSIKTHAQPPGRLSRKS